jgi:hypothetical protein
VKVFVEFYTPSTGWNGTDYSGPIKPTLLLGSDGVFPLDGRFGIRRLHEAARNRIKQLSRVQHHICGYRLLRGNLRSSRPITAVCATE